jgi:hypothetical protein
VSTGSQGFGVEAGQLQQVARQFDGEGADLIAIKDTVVTNVGEGQVGKRFGAVAPPYRQAFEQFGRNLVKFGDQTIKISVRLNDVAAAYARTEDANQTRMRTVR